MKFIQIIGIGFVTFVIAPLFIIFFFTLIAGIIGSVVDMPGNTPTQSTTESCDPRSGCW